MSNDEQADIRRKLAQICKVKAVYQSMDVAGLSYQDWLQKESDLDNPLRGANRTELKLKEEEIRKLEGGNGPEKLLHDAKLERAIMKEKMQIMCDLKTALDAALDPHSPPEASLDQEVADLVSAVSQHELKLKQQQIATLSDRIRIDPTDKELSALQTGEQREVDELVQICPLNEQIAGLVRSSGDAATIASLRRRVAHHELRMKQQNIDQLEARLTSGPKTGCAGPDGANA